jgi:hypothetical protein
MQGTVLPPLRAFLLSLAALAAVPACAQPQDAATTNAADLPRKDDRPREDFEGFATHYGAVAAADGVRLRTLLTIPDGAKARPHPLLFTQWVSCGSVEFQNADSDLAILARDSGLALARVERAGSGDSEGPACGALDYDTEVAHYVAAFSAMLRDEKLDASRVFLYGSSLGATTAPLVAAALQAAGHDVAGVVVQGGGALTHFERMLNFDRFYLERRPDAVPPDKIHDEMNARARFHAEYLIKGRHPDDVAKDSPEMAAVRADVRGLGKDDHYGRPFLWHQQAARRDFLAAWAKLDADVLVIFNEYDQFETEHGHRLIADTLNRLRPGTAEFVIQKGLDHSSWRFDGVIEAYADETGAPEPATTAATIIRWLRERT